MIYEICEFEMMQEVNKSVVLCAKGNKRYIEYFNGEVWFISKTVDSEKALEIYQAITGDLINGYLVELDSYGIF